MTTVETLMMAGRVILGAFFLIAGIRNFASFSERKAGPTNYGWLLPAPLIGLGFAVQVLGGLLLILNVWTVAAALVLIAFTALATIFFHNLFMFRGAERAPHLYLTLVNITLCGGLLLVIADTW